MGVPFGQVQPQTISSFKVDVNEHAEQVIYLFLNIIIRGAVHVNLFQRGWPENQIEK